MKLKQAMIQFAKAAQELENAMIDATPKEEDAYTGADYPFREAFCDLNSMIQHWKDQTVKHLESKECQLCGGRMHYRENKGVPTYDCETCPGVLTLRSEPSPLFVDGSNKIITRRSYG